MLLSKDISDHIVSVSCSYLGTPFDYEKFNCVHFVRQVYAEVGINFPLLSRLGLPPPEFHLSVEEFSLMTIGHAVFFKRRERISERLWTHVAIVFDSEHLIHCTRHLGRGVVITSKINFMEVYNLAPTGRFF